MIKRIFDIIGAGVLLVLSAPVLLMAMAAVRFTMGSPVLFRQTRPGYRGRPFTLLKLRTMVDEAPGSPSSDGARLTGLGRILRRTSIDELPQLVNVLRGDMSLVGPRPLLMEYLPLYTPEQARRHEVRPGLTGWAQIHGRNSLDWPERLKLDVWYVDNVSFSLDIRILAVTVWTVLTRRGISHGNQPTMHRFTGQ